MGYFRVNWVFEFSGQFCNIESKSLIKIAQKFRYFMHFSAKNQFLSSGAARFERSELTAGGLAVAAEGSGLRVNFIIDKINIIGR